MRGTEGRGVYLRELFLTFAGAKSFDYDRLAIITNAAARV